LIPAISAILGWLAFFFFLLVYLNDLNLGWFVAGSLLFIAVSVYVLRYLSEHMPGFAEHHCLEEMRRRNDVKVACLTGPGRTVETQVESDSERGNGAS
jgi:hypothetical protein